MTEVLLVAATEPELCGHDGLVCGVGPVEAAARSDAVLHVGIAGARRSAGLTPGQLVLGSVAIYEDLPQTSGIAPREVHPDVELLDLVRATLPDAPVLPIGTTGRVGGGSDACDVEAMEGFAVLRAAVLAGVPAVELRAISNFVDDARADWRIDQGLAALANGISRVLPALAR